MGVLDTVNAVVTDLKKVRELADKVHDADLQNAIADLVLKVADLKTEVADFREENLGFRQQIEELTRKADIRSKLTIDRGRLRSPEGLPGYGKGPFCQVCFEKDGYLFALVYDAQANKVCPNCGT
jgi:hypothetical protein